MPRQTVHALWTTSDDDEIQIELWLSVSKPVRLGVGSSFGAHDQIFIFLDLKISGIECWGARSDERTGL
jgi:hypothetical protein